MGSNGRLKMQDSIPYENIGKQEYEIEIFNTLRKVKRAGNELMSLSPEILIFTDCTHPMQNIIVPESEIKSWKRI